jgi:hypothetical protein
VVKAGRPYTQSFRLLETHDSVFASWVAFGYLNAAVEAALRSAFAIRTRVTEGDERLRRLDEERVTLHEEQSRIQANLTALGDRASERDLRERYVRSLGKQEDRLEAIDKERAATASARDQARQELHAALNAISMDRTVSA